MSQQSQQPFRFLHASDFHLEQPPYGLAEVPDHLRAALLESPFVAAERVFEAAVRESVDFVVLSGDLLDPYQAGARGITFLLEQFERLDQQGIAVYWSGGNIDRPEHWPAAAQLPSSVHWFAPGKTEELSHFREDQPLATVVGQSHSGRERIRSSDFAADPAGQFTVVVAYGRGDAELLAKQRVHYWALGGQHDRKTLLPSPHVAHYPGSPQGRCPQETGPHGCTLAQVDASGKVHTQLIPTDAVRWHREQLVLADGATQDELQRLLGERMQRLVAVAAERCVLVEWTITAGGRLGSLLRHGGLAPELLDWLRSQYGQAPSPAWTVALDVQPPAVLPAAWYEEDTLLGDLLRAARQYEDDPKLPLVLQGYLSECPAAARLESELELTDPEARARVLREVAILGVDLLRGDREP